MDEDLNSYKKTHQANDTSEMTRNYRIQKRMNILLRHKIQINTELKLSTQGLDAELQQQYRLFETAFSNLITCESKHLKIVQLE